MKKTKIFSFVTAMTLSLGGWSQIVINEIRPSESIVELKNIGTTTEDISDWYLCGFVDGPAYNIISGLTVESGGDPTSLEAGELVVLSGRDMTVEADELALYETNAYTDPTQMRDYLRWGIPPGDGRLGVAIAAGIWSPATYLPSLLVGEGYEFDGEEYPADFLVDYYRSTAGSVGFENKNTCAIGIPFGGEVSLTSDATSLVGVAGTEQLEFYVQNNSMAPLSYWYIITDADDYILGYVNSMGADSTMLDLSGAGDGVCRVWGWSYSGLPTPVMGEHISTLNDDACESISENFITVYRQIPDAGLVSLTSGATSLVGVSGTDQLEFHVENTGTADMLSYWYVITDAENNILTWTIASGLDSALLDLSGAGVGVCRVWGWSYRGLDDPIIGANIFTLDNDDEEDLSDNWITVYRQLPDGGTLQTTDGITAFSGVAGTDQVVFYTEHETTADMLSYWYVITDADDNILNWVNTMGADSSIVDLSGAGDGLCHVWGWSYRGLDDPIIGAHISTLNDDVEEEISEDFITVYRQTPDGGTISLTTGATEFSAPVGTDLTVFYAQHETTADMLSYWYIITDSDDNILGWTVATGADSTEVDLSGAGVGECHVWGWSYKGLSDPIIGENISTLNDDAEEDISDNWITVYRQEPDAGLVNLTTGGTELSAVALTDQAIFYIENDGTADKLSYWYVITDNDNNILNWVVATGDDSTLIDLSAISAGTCRVWGWSYKGLDDPIIGANIFTLDNDDEEDLSDNWVTVFRQEPNGGTVALTSEETSLTVAAESSDAMFYVQHETNADRLSYWYIYTDTDNNIIGWKNSFQNDSTVVDFTTFAVGEYRIWGWSYKGLDDPIIGENISTLNDAVEEEISNNWITVTLFDAETASIEDFEANNVQLNVYPVPAANEINVATDAAIDFIQIYDMSGKILTTQNGFEQSNVLVDLSNFNAGFYLVNVTYVNGANKNVRITKK